MNIKSSLALGVTLFVPLVFAWVDLDHHLIKALDLCSLPVLSLGAPGSLPSQLLNEIISTAAPNVSLQQGDGGQFAYDGDRLVGYVNSSTGETRVFPDLSRLAPAGEGGINITRINSFISESQAFPIDNTTISAIRSGNLFGSSTGGNTTSTPELFLSHALVTRNVTYGGKTYPVCGPGSTASFGFDGTGAVHSLAYQWHPATFTGQIISPNDTYAISNSIKAHLEPVGLETDGLKVEGIDVCFYDSGARFIQPVLRFWGILHDSSPYANNGSVAPTHFQGYLSIGAGSPEALPAIVSPSDQITPSFTQPPDNNDTAPPDEVIRLSGRYMGRSVAPPKPSITIGRYVVRDDATAWVTNANNFWAQISASKLYNFINQQYYWAYPFEFTTNKNSYINSVNVAEIEVHGNWDLFSTEKNCCDLVSLSDIPADGYGGGAGGSLAYWILHSCEVIPTPTDFAVADSHKAFDPWFKVFNGMHAAVGYRTEMYIADGVMPVFGKLIALGGAFVSSWLQAVHTDSSYKNNPTFFSDNRQIVEPLGRASAVVVCGHESDTVSQISNIGRPTCLREFWYNN